MFCLLSVFVLLAVFVFVVLETGAVVVIVLVCIWLVARDRPIVANLSVICLRITSERVEIKLGSNMFDDVDDVVAVDEDDSDVRGMVDVDAFDEFDVVLDIDNTNIYI